MSVCQEPIATKYQLWFKIRNRELSAHYTRYFQTGAKIVVDFDQWTYNLKQHDWINKQTGETLTNYTPPHDLLDVLKNRIDTERE